MLSLFMARAPLMRLAKQRHRRGSFGARAGDYWYSALVYLVLAAVFFILVASLGEGWELWQIASAAALLAALQTLSALALGERSMTAELTGVVLLALAAPLGYYLAAGDGLWGVESVTLWAANATYYGATVFNVKMKVASMVTRRDSLGGREKLALARESITYATIAVPVWVALALTGKAPAAAPVVFTPMAAYVAWSAATMSSRLKLKTEGFTQLGLSLAFTAALIAVWRYGW